jgi:hypothetical protein
MSLREKEHGIGGWVENGKRRMGMQDEVKTEEQRRNEKGRRERTFKSTILPPHRHP